VGPGCGHRHHASLPWWSTTSTSLGPASVSRCAHWSLMLMLYCPWRSPRSSSSRLPGHAGRRGTQRPYTLAVGRLGEYLAGIDAELDVTDDLRREHIEGFLNALSDQGLAPATINQRYRSLMRFFGYVVEEGRSRRTPMAHIRPPKVPEQPAGADGGPGAGTAVDRAGSRIWYGGGVVFERITHDPAVTAGVPCIRGMRVPVATVVGMVAEGMTADEDPRRLPLSGARGHRRDAALCRRGRP